MESSARTPLIRYRVPCDDPVSEPSAYKAASTPGLLRTPTHGGSANAKCDTLDYEVTGSAVIDLERDVRRRDAAIRDNRRTIERLERRLRTLQAAKQQQQQQPQGQQQQSSPAFVIDEV